MKLLVGLIIGIVIGAAGYWFIDERDADLKIEAKGNDGGDRISVSGKDLKAEAEKVGEELKEAGTKAAEVASDATITGTVKLKLAADTHLSAREINVDTANRVVTLNGRVATAELIDKAVEIAKSVPGVKDVKSNLEVQP
jgi:hyperosmotically inducible protein